MVRFAMGVRSADLLPIGKLNLSYEQARTGRFDYGESQGEPSLREQVISLSSSQAIEAWDERVTFDQI